MTPKEFRIIVEITNEKQKQEAEKDLLNAYMTAYFHRIDKLETFETYRGKMDEQDKPKSTGMSDESMLRMVEQLNARMGGNTKGVDT